MPERPFDKMMPHPWRAAKGVTAGQWRQDGLGVESMLALSAAAERARAERAAAEPSAAYAELMVTSNYTFLTGASHPEELVVRAAELGHRAIAITDRHTLAGVVRAHVAAKDAGIGLVVGTRVAVEGTEGQRHEGTKAQRHEAMKGGSDCVPPCLRAFVPSVSLLLLAGSREGYATISRLLTIGKRRSAKGQCRLTLEDLLPALAEEGGGEGCGVQVVVVPPRSAIHEPVAIDEWFVELVEGLRSAWCVRRGGMIADRLSIAATRLYEPGDADRLAALANLAEHTRVPMVAVNDVHYHVPARAELQDVLVCVREGCTLDQAGLRLFASGERYLKPPAEMARLFAEYPSAVARSVEIAERCLGREGIGGPRDRGIRGRRAQGAEGAMASESGAARSVVGPESHAGFSLDELRYEYPDEVVPAGVSAMEHLRSLTWRGAAERYGEGRAEGTEGRRDEGTEGDGGERAGVGGGVGGVPGRVAAQIEHELRLIEELNYAHYFLTVHDIVTFARSRGILCQGRGAAANSAVCYCLGVTAVDPDRIDVLFERFISKERNEPPDIDIDFEHERREEVIQYLYAKYGRDRAALTAEVISYRGRSAVRDVGKALGLSLDAVEAIAKTIDWWERGLGGEKEETEGRRDEEMGEAGGAEGETSRQAGARGGRGSTMPARLGELGLSVHDPTIARLLRLGRELLGFPRHLSQHVGGFVITRGPLCELVPIENAAMPDRTVIEWDKDDVDAMGMLKVDVLGLGMLTCLRRAMDVVARSSGQQLALHTIPPEDPAVYDMICAADTVGVFQIESRAQMSMLPRLKPRCFYDLVIEVAIVRPGPIQGDMVHPYLRRRDGKEPVHYHDEKVRKILGKTLGVPLFQEQAMSLAIHCAGFTPGEADQLRRAIAAWKTKTKVIYAFGKKIISGMVARGYPREFAERCFEQLKGFSEYGFPESHAASFALLVYASAWLKRHHPAEFAAALINSQPMGFYAPAQIVADAKAHGVEVRGIDVNLSGWACDVEGEGTEGAGDRGSKVGGAGRVSLGAVAADGSSRQRVVPSSPHPALRLGLCLVDGLGEEQGRLIERAVRERGPFRDPGSLWRASGASAGAMRKLAEADAFGSMGLDRQRALWAVQGLKDEVLPLFEAVGAGERGLAASLPVIAPAAQVLQDYAATGLSLKAHPVSFAREALAARGVRLNGELKDESAFPHGKDVRVAGVVLVRQRPHTAGGVMFITIEDESGPANLIVRPKIYEAYRRATRHGVLIVAGGRVQRQGAVVHVLVRWVREVSGMVPGLSAQSRDFR
jgi:error-prone DNA polymerase